MIERERIAVLDQAGVGVREIARRLGRSASTISRELRRNRAPHDVAYHPGLAHVRARERACRDRTSVFAREVVLRDLVQAKLELQWTPRADCRRAAVDLSGPDRLARVRGDDLPGPVSGRTSGLQRVLTET